MERIFSTFLKKHRVHACFLAIILLLCLLLTARAQRPVSVEQQLKSMTLREKVGQLFMVRPEALIDTLTDANFQKAIARGQKELTPDMIRFYQKYPAGGFCLHENNIVDSTQILDFTKALHELSNRPLLSLDEEGGRVTRLAYKKEFDLPEFESMTDLAQAGEQATYQAAKAIGTYVRYFGFDLDFAPVADVNTNPENIVIGNRAFSSHPETAAQMVGAYVRGLQEAGVWACLKHFPGHGDTQADTHYGYAATQKTWEEMDTCEMVTFRRGIREGARFIMTAHIAAPKVTETDLPSTLSPVILQEKLRGKLGYKGIIVTDALEMGAIKLQYSSGEACVKAIQAGVDLLLMPFNYRESFEAVLKAVQTGKISQKRLNESVRRILEVKKELEKGI